MGTLSSASWRAELFGIGQTQVGDRYGESTQNWGERGRMVCSWWQEVNSETSLPVFTRCSRLSPGRLRVFSLSHITKLVLAHEQ